MMIRTLFALCLLSQAAFSQNEVQWSHSTPAVISAFVENKGQVMDQQNMPNTSVKYIYTNGLFNLQLKSDGFSYELFQLEEKQPSFTAASNFEHNGDQAIAIEEGQYEFHSTRIDVKFIGSATREMIPTDNTGTLQNFYTSNTGENGITGVQSFYSITYKNVYPGIDLVFFAPDEENQSLKYEWKVNAGADPSAIKMEYHGVASLEQLEDGSIDVITSAGKINESKIVAYTAEDNLTADVQYTVHDNMVGYRNTRKSDKTLIIDPNITWFTYYGGTSTEDLFEGELSIDYKGNPLVVGNTMSPQYIASTGAYQVTYGEGGVDGFVAKFKPNGKLWWATYYGSNNRDGCHAVTTDASNNVFVGGNTFSSTGIATPGSHQPEMGGLMDAFFVKFNSDGIRLWATYYGGTGYGDQISAMECDASGNFYFTGYTCSANAISTPGVYQETYNGVDDVTGDVMVGKFTNDGTRVWGSYHSGPGQDRPHDLALLGNGEFYVAGTCESLTEFATPGVHQSTYGGGPQDGFIAKWDTSGQLIWCSYYGGEKEEHGRGLAIDSEGSGYIGGWTNSETGIGTPGASQPDLAEGYNEQGIPTADGYLGKFTSEGLLDWGTYIGGPGVERSRGIAIDKDNDFIYVVGQAGSKDLSTTNVFQADTGLINGDGFVAKYLIGGSRPWFHFVGGIGTQTAFDVDLDKFKSLYISMTTDKTFFTSSKVYQTASNGDVEVMLLKLNPADYCFDKYEPNNTSLTAQKITTSSDALFYGSTGVIAEANDIDWLYFKTTETTNLKIALTDLVVDYDLYLYKSNGQLISSSTNIGDINETIIFNNAPKAKYLIKIVPMGSSFEPNSCYRINAFTNSSPWLLKTADENMLANQLDMQVHVYPNPATDQVNLKITSNESATLNAKIFNLSQQLMWFDEFSIQEGSQILSMNVKELPQGMYLLYLEEEGKSMLTKIIVQR